MQVNLDRFSLFFPEKRVFFLENAGQFSVGNPREVEFFFSRRIGVGRARPAHADRRGARLSGKVGQSTNVGLLHMRTEDQPGTAPRERLLRGARPSQELREPFLRRRHLHQPRGRRLAAARRRRRLQPDLRRRRSLGHRPLRDRERLGRHDRHARPRRRRSRLQPARGLRFAALVERHRLHGGRPRTSIRRSASCAGTTSASSRARVLYRYRPDDWFGILELRPHVAYRLLGFSRARRSPASCTSTTTGSGRPAPRSTRA